MRQIRKNSARLLALAAVPLAMTLAVSAGAQYPGQGRYPDQQRNPNQQQQQNGTQPLFEWAGRVDSEIRIQADGRGASVVQVGRAERGSGRLNAMNALPSQDGTVAVRVLEGRGRVDVVQQPNRRNGYTAIIRVRDPQGGASRYRLAAYFTPSGNSYRGRRRGNR